MRSIFGGAIRAAALLAVIAISGQACAAGYTGVCSMTNPGNCLEPNADGTMPVAGSFSATLSGFAGNGATAQLTGISTSSTSVALPTGQVVKLFNAGTNRIHYKLGVDSATAAATDTAIEPGATRTETVGANNVVAAVTDSGTSTLQIYGGTGLAVDSGGGSGGSGSGGNVNLNQVGGNAVASGNGATDSGTLRVTLSNDGTGQVKLSSGSAVGIDQVTPNANNVVVSGGSVDTSGSTVNSLTNDGSANPITSTGGALDVNLKSGTGTGLATAANQSTANSSLSTIATNTTGVATASGQSTGNASLATIATNTTGVATAAGQTTGNNSLATIATNTTGAATAALQTTGNTTLSTISSNVATAANQTAVTGSKAGGTAAASSQLTGGVYNTSAPTLTNGQQAATQMDVNGNIKVAVVSGGGSNASVGTVGSTAPTSATAIGLKDGSGNLQIPSATNPLPVTGGVSQGSATSGQTGSLIQAATVSSAPTYTNATTNPLTTDTAGNLRVNVVAGGGSGGTSSTFGSAFPGTGTAMGLKNGSNMVNGTADASGNMNVNVAAGTVAATQSGTWNVTNISGTVSLPTGAATSAKQPALGTAGSPSTDVISVQGVASGTAIPISGAVTQSGTWTVQPGNTANTTPWLTQDKASTPTSTLSLTNSVVTVTGSAGKLQNYVCGNVSNSSPTFIQIFDASSPTLGTTTPTAVIPLPANSTANVGNLNWTFSTAIKVAATTTATGSTAPSSTVNCTFGVN